MITIDYFSDLLCVWAYGGQVRLETLQNEFRERVLVRQRFVTLFADTAVRIGEGWQDKGGFEGFGRHMHEVCAQWEHTHLADGVWSECRPASSTTSHVFLKAASLCMGIESEDATDELRTRFDRLVNQVREAFFEQAQDIGDVKVLRHLLVSASIDVEPDAVLERIDNGEAYAALHRDQELAKSYGVLGSPTYVFNEGRQLLYGNVGYRIIEANVSELLSAHHVAGEPSWC